MPDWFLFKLVLDSFGLALGPMAPLLVEVLKQKMLKLIFGLDCELLSAFMAISAVPEVRAPDRNK